jgi:hypothetical protein
MADIEKHESLTDGFVHFQQLKFCVNTPTQYTSANINIPSQDHFLSLQHQQHVDRTIANAILQKGSRGFFRQFSPHAIDLSTTMLQMPHAMVDMV